jgi:hypothetical protein
MFDWALARPQPRGAKKRLRAATVKSYIIESTIPEHGDSTQVVELLESTLTGLDVFASNSVKVRVADEKTLAAVNGRIGSEAVEAHVDFTNPRFWILHSISDADALDRLAGRWTTMAPEVDRAWFPISLLSTFRELGQLTGVSLFFDSSDLHGRGEPAPDRVDEALKMRFRGTQADQVLKTVQADGSGCEHQAALSSIRLRAGTEAVKISSEIRHDGRITARGNSFAEHTFVVTSVLRAYRKLISVLESDYALRPQVEDGELTIAGSPICLVLPVALPDVERFCSGVFSCNAPFRLFGVPIRIHDDYYYVQAIDMHTSGLLRFEVLPKLIRVYLLQGTCGNAVLRFITNLQHSLDARIEFDLLAVELGDK